MDEPKNGHCKDQTGGCLEFRLLERRVKTVEDFIKELKDNQKWDRRFLKTAAGSALVSVAMLFIKLFLMG